MGNHLGMMVGSSGSSAECPTPSDMSTVAYSAACCTPLLWSRPSSVTRTFTEPGKALGSAAARRPARCRGVKGVEHGLWWKSPRFSCAYHVHKAQWRCGGRTQGMCGGRGSVLTVMEPGRALGCGQAACEVWNVWKIARDGTTTKVLMHDMRIVGLTDA